MIFVDLTVTAPTYHLADSTVKSKLISFKELPYWLIDLINEHLAIKQDPELSKAFIHIQMSNIVLNFHIDENLLKTKQ